MPLKTVRWVPLHQSGLLRHLAFNSRRQCFLETKAPVNLKRLQHPASDPPCKSRYNGSNVYGASKLVLRCLVCALIFPPSRLTFTIRNQGIRDTLQRLNRNLSRLNCYQNRTVSEESIENVNNRNTLERMREFFCCAAWPSPFRDEV